MYESGNTELEQAFANVVGLTDEGTRALLGSAQTHDVTQCPNPLCCFPTAGIMYQCDTWHRGLPVNTDLLVAWPRKDHRWRDLMTPARRAALQELISVKAGRPVRVTFVREPERAWVAYPGEP